MSTETPRTRTITTAAQRAEWWKYYGVGMTSAVGEYTPSAFWDLLNDCNTLERDLTAARERVAELEAGCIRTLAHLVAAVSLLEHGGKKAAASDKMFAQMLADYNATITTARALLAPSSEPKP